MPPRDLYIVRHGIAEAENPDHPGSDHWRRLTPRGRARMIDGARGMLRLDLVPDVLLSSPHIRAVETAATISEVLGLGPVTPCDSLSFSGSNREVRDDVAAVEGDRVMLVGHNPMLSDLVSELTAGGRLQLSLKKGSLAHVRLHETARGTVGELVMILAPRALRAVGGER